MRDTVEMRLKRLYSDVSHKGSWPRWLPSAFFQRHWDICGNGVTSVVLRIVEGTETAASINETVLVLIPKVKNPTLNPVPTDQFVQCIVQDRFKGNVQPPKASVTRLYF